MDNYTNFGSSGGIRSAFTYRKEAPRSLFRVHTWGGSVEGVTFTCEPQLAVVPLVLQQLPEFREHLPAVAADQYIWIAYDIPSIKPNLHCSTRYFVMRENISYSLQKILIMYFVLIITQINQN